MQLFDEDAAIVTGAGNGIGRAIAQALVREGVNTVFADLNAETVGDAVAEMASEGSGDTPVAQEAVGSKEAPAEAHAWSGDLAEPPQWQALLDFAAQEVGKVTMLVHSAAPPRHERDHIMDVDDETWRRMHAVNLDCAFALGRNLARGWMADGIPGRILLLTSLHAQTPRNLPHYSSAKGGMEMLMKEFAKSLGQHGIRVNALVPGAVAAGGFNADPALARHIPLGRLGAAVDLAPMALAVLSNRTGGYITGTSIVIDGGLSLCNWFDPPQLSNA